MADEYEKEIENLYIRLKEKIIEENGYLKKKNEFDEKKMFDLVMEKRIITDKIDKRSDKDKLTNITKIRIQSIIKEMMKIEVENEEIYEKNLEEIQKDIFNLLNEKKLKDKYGAGNNKTFFIDEKK